MLHQCLPKNIKEEKHISFSRYDILAGGKKDGFSFSISTKKYVTTK